MVEARRHGLAVHGHKWLVRAVRGKFPFAARRWAPPIPGTGTAPPEVGKAERVRHRTPAEPMCRLLRAMRIRFPGRALLFAGDAGFRPHAVARFCHHRRQLTLVSKLCPDANRFAPPPPYAGNGRPRVSPARVKLAVAWYGGRGTAPSRGCSDWG